jgi:glycerol-3-phosphate dehydrogenase (NAD(P)+)
VTPGRVAVLGAGSWGTTLAHLLAAKGASVWLWSHNAQVAEQIRSERVNRLYLDGIPLPASLRVTTELAEALADAEAAVCAVPSHALREVLERARVHVPRDVLWVNAVKGLEVDTLLTPAQITRDLLPHAEPVALSGPSFAREVAEGHPTTVVVACPDPSRATAAQRLLHAPHLRVYTNADRLGVELGGALKNVMAIAAGIAEGLGYGHNTRAALITRGLAEMTRLGVAMGAQALTFAGLAGVGDLILTCTGTLSRNRGVGLRLARGEPLDGILAGMRMVAEGVNTTRAALRLAERHDVEVPITREVHAVLFEGKRPRQAVEDLMLRTPKPEVWGVRDA